MDKISICITYYNQEGYVDASLGSVLSQQFPCEFEILIGDDGSTDGTLSVLQKYQASYPDKIKLYATSTDRQEKSINRASANRLNLLRHATGNYIAFLDGDDYYCDKSFLSDAWYELKKERSFIACAFNFKYLHQDGTEQIFPQQMKEGKYGAAFYVATGCYTPAGAILFRNIVGEDRWKELHRINNFDDNAITIYFLQYGDLKYIDRPVYTYRQTGNSLWNSCSSIEKDLINALDCKLISDIAPSLKKEIVKRLYPSVQQCFKHRSKLSDLLGERRHKYITAVQSSGDYFMGSLLRWEELNLWEKIKILYLWQKLKRQLNLVNYAMLSKTSDG